ncbi:hypothetical protein [Kibdelosporangium aridum]|uniref:hypothetical protein n=1 Tax=Kibdelosporangium aridum TaxID=2030 RepID=UPI0038995BE2
MALIEAYDLADVVRVDGRGDREGERASFARGEGVDDRDVGSLVQGSFGPVAQRGSRAENRCERTQIVWTP